MSAKKTTEAEALEIIELALNDLDVLTRAFTVLTETWSDEPLVTCADAVEPAIAIH